MTANDFSNALLSALEQSGWIRIKKKTAWVQCADADLIVELQKSNYDETVFANVGVALHALGSAAPPKYADCHLQFRAERLLKGFPTDVVQDIEELRREVQAVEPALRAFGDLHQLQRKAAAGELAGTLVRKEARSLLWGEESPPGNEPT